MTPGSSNDYFFYPVPVGFGGQWGYYTDYTAFAQPAGAPVGYGLILLGQRFYDPGTARFLTRDPIGYEGGINIYAYTGNNPVNSADPLGTQTIPGNIALDPRFSTNEKKQIRQMISMILKTKRGQLAMSKMTWQWSINKPIGSLYVARTDPFGVINHSDGGVRKQAQTVFSPTMNDGKYTLHDFGTVGQNGQVNALAAPLRTLAHEFIHASHRFPGLANDYNAENKQMWTLFEEGRACAGESDIMSELGYRRRARWQTNVSLPTVPDKPRLPGNK